MNIATLLKQFPALLVSTVIVAAVVILGYFHHIDATDAAGAITALVGALGLTGVVVLANQSMPNALLISHVIVTVEIIAGIVVLALHSVFGSAQTVPLLYLFITGGTVAVAVGAITTTRTRGTLPPPASSGTPPVTG